MRARILCACTGAALAAACGGPTPLGPTPVTISSSQAQAIATEMVNGALRGFANNMTHMLGQSTAARPHILWQFQHAFPYDFRYSCTTGGYQHTAGTFTTNAGGSDNDFFAQANVNMTGLIGWVGCGEQGLVINSNPEGSIAGTMTINETPTSEHDTMDLRFDDNWLATAPNGASLACHESMHLSFDNIVCQTNGFTLQTTCSDGTQPVNAFVPLGC